MAGKVNAHSEVSPAEIGWRYHYRLVSSQLPTVSLFEDYVDPDLLEAAFEIEGRTNPRLRAEAGHLSLVSKKDYVLGPGSSPVMAAFTHVGRPSRFTDGRFGVYYAGNSIDTAIAEIRFHRERFMSHTNEPSTNMTLRSYRATLRKPLVDLRKPKFHKYCRPDINSYPDSQQLGAEVKAAGYWGMVYSSVRDRDGQCIALLRPPATTIPKQGLHYSLHWNGELIDRIYEIRNWKSSRKRD